MDFVTISHAELQINEYVCRVSHPAAGAVTTFSGITRDNFDGKAVERLEYEAYEPMALTEMEKLCKRIRERWSVKGIAIGHRIGVVPVSEPSVIISVSSPHRKESLAACTFAIDELKAKVPIWKKEYYRNESEKPLWKKNPESLKISQPRVDLKRSRKIFFFAVPIIIVAHISVN